MKHLFLGLFVLVGAVQAQELTPSQVASTYNYNNSPSAKIKHKRLLKKMATVKEEEATNIAKESCESEVSLSKLTRHGKRLFYAMKTETCSIKIDALDGSIMTRKLLK